MFHISHKVGTTTQEIFNKCNFIDVDFNTDSSTFLHTCYGIHTDTTKNICSADKLVASQETFCGLINLYRCNIGPEFSFFFPF